VLVVGSGWHFTSGISYYTCRLANALGAVTPTRALLMRSLVPRALYPGRSRVGVAVHDLHYDDGVAVFDGLDWWWGGSMVRAQRFLRADPPDVIVLQWWTGAVLHSYLALVWLARRRGARVVVEWHEVQDTGEARIPGVVRYVRSAMRVLLRQVDAHVVHSQYDLDLLQHAYGLDPTQVTVVPHGPYDHVSTAATAVQRTVDGPLELLYFGVIRPYKGVEDLVEAFGRLPERVVADMRLTIVGEAWEGWTAPFDAIAASPVKNRIHLVQRYVTDDEVARYFAAADAVVLPYRRSSSSGPLHIAMSAGLPVVLTSVGGLVEAAGDYEGVAFVPPQDPGALSAALERLPSARGQRYADPHSWDASLAAYRSVLTDLGLPDWHATTGIAGSSNV